MARYHSTSEGYRDGKKASFSEPTEVSGILKRGGADSPANHAGTAISAKGTVVYASAGSEGTLQKSASFQDAPTGQKMEAQAKVRKVKSDGNASTPIPDVTNSRELGDASTHVSFKPGGPSCTSFGSAQSTQSDFKKSATTGSLGSGATGGKRLLPNLFPWRRQSQDSSHNTNSAPGRPQLQKAATGTTFFKDAGGGLAKSITMMFGEEDAARGGRPATIMFADTKKMKDQLHQNLDQKDYDVVQLYSETGWWQLIARDNRFQNIALFVIACNTVWIGVDTDANKDGIAAKDLPVYFILVENLFCVLFSLELFTRFMAFKQKQDCFIDGWFRFDTFLVTLMIVETWIIPLALSGSDAGSEMSNISILRLLRLLRLTRLVRIMRSIPELITMLKGVKAATRSVLATLALLVIALYIFSIIFTQQLSGVEELESYFGSISKSMWTLLLRGTFLDDVTKTLQKLREFGGSQSGFMVAMFLLFILVSSLTILNLLIGVLVEVVSAVAVAEKEKAVVTYVKSQLIDVLQELDTDGTGTISEHELEGLVEFPQACEALEQLGVDIPTLLQLAEVIFDMDGAQEGFNKGKSHHEQSSAELTFGEFMEMVLRLRAENAATVPDIVDLRKYIKRENTKLTGTGKECIKMLRKQELRLSQLDLKVDKVSAETKSHIGRVESQLDGIKSEMGQMHLKIDRLLFSLPRPPERLKTLEENESAEMLPIRDAPSPSELPNSKPILRASKKPRTSSPGPSRGTRWL